MEKKQCPKCKCTICGDIEYCVCGYRFIKEGDMRKAVDELFGGIFNAKKEDKNKK